MILYIWLKEKRETESIAKIMAIVKDRMHQVIKLTDLILFLGTRENI
jgi:hypothetical protein